MNISIIYNGTNLYPEHIYDWSREATYCASDDYTIGNVGLDMITFETDIKPNIGDTISDGYYDYKIIDITKSTGIRYKVKAISSDINLDTVVDDWLETLTFPIGLNALGQSLISWLTGTTFTGNVISFNDNYQVVSEFGYSGLTARTVLQWICQISGTNIRNIFKRTSNGVYQIGRFGPGQSHGDGEISFLSSNTKKIDMADYEVPVIDKIWYGSDADDVGISYGTGTEQLSVPYNPLINPEDTSFVQTAYSRVNIVAPYTPMKILVFLDSIDNWWDIINGKVSFTYDNKHCPIFSYRMTPQGLEIEGTGNSSRSGINSIISSEIQQNGKYNKFKRTLDETVSEIADLDGNVSTLTQTVNGLTSTVSNLAPKSSAIQTDTLYYLATSASSGVTRSTSGWTTTVQAMTATNQYLWTYHEYTYADNHTGYSDPVITGRYGQNGTNGTNGTDGVGITSITTLYRNKANTTAPAKPTAHVTQTGNVNNAWTTAVPSLSSSYPYLFTCDEILYTNGTYGWTDVVQNNALTTFNSTLSQQADKISLVVTENQGSNVINAASIVTAINSAGSSVDISADHINLNGAVTANNNVTIGQDGVISAVGASLTNASIVGGSFNVDTSNDFSRVRITWPNNYESLLQASGLKTYEVPATTTTYYSSYSYAGWSLESSGTSGQGDRALGNSYNGIWSYNDTNGTYVKMKPEGNLELTGTITKDNKYKIGYYGNKDDNNGAYLDLYKNKKIGISIDAHYPQVIFKDTTATTPPVTMKLDTSGLYFYNASGVTTGYYPATGITIPTPTTTEGTISFSSGWSNAQTDDTVLRYTFLRKNGNVVELCISATTSTSHSGWNQMASLPTGYRPSKNINCHGYNNVDDSNAIFRILTDGSVNVYGDKRQPCLHVTFVI